MCGLLFLFFYCSGLPFLAFPLKNSSWSLSIGQLIYLCEGDGIEQVKVSKSSCSSALLNISIKDMGSKMKSRPAAA